MANTDALESFRHIFEHLHAHPELSGAEVETTAYIRALLEDWGVRVLESSLKTGLLAEVGTITGEASDYVQSLARSGGPGETLDSSNASPAQAKTVALRADIDALPIEETTGLPYSSLNPGVMHACGHDFHTTALLAAAYQLKQQEADLPGRVLFIFQPAEEAAGGAAQVIATGLLQDVDAFIGLHNTPDLAPGHVSLEPGPVMAAVDQFKVTVTGVGTHAAAPHTGVDTVVALSAIVDALHHIVSRTIDPLEPAVLSVTHIEVGTTWNVLPDSGFFEGTLRSFSTAVSAKLRERFITVVNQVAAAYEVSAAIEWIQDAFPPTINDTALVETLRPAVARVLDLAPLPPSTGGEDFAFYGEIAPAAFAKVGANGTPGAPGWHHSDFTVLPEALPFAATFYTTCAWAVLNSPAR